jgi:Flp pilus assembly protein TadD/peroxiredoxin
MAGHDHEKRILSRRKFLKGMRWAPVLFIPAAMGGLPFRPLLSGKSRAQFAFPFDDVRLTPHYPTKSSLDDVLRLVTPGADEFVTEKYALEIMRLLDEWSASLKSTPPGIAVLREFLDPSIKATRLVPENEIEVRAGYGIEVLRRKFAADLVSGRERFLDEIKNYLAPITSFETAEFEITGIEDAGNSSVKVDIRYTLVGRRNEGREQRIGYWFTRWSPDEHNAWRVLDWRAAEETLSRAREPIFFGDITAQALGQTQSYKNQMLRGVDHWRTVMDGASGIDVYGNNGVAVGDIDNDGFDEVYICQPAGLPNRLYRNRGNGTFEDVTEQSGVGVLDATACALFADFENKGLQDLLVVCGSGPLLFLNQGNGKFVRKRDAFKFEQPPQGTFTHAALADYDRDGRLDIYFCVYNYYLGLDQYHYPAPYFDARNGPPNFLFHNEGNAVFQDQTEAAGLNIENDRYSFACTWGDYNSDGWPDLYVVNDFGRNSLYRSNGDGTFAAVSGEAQVDEVGAGMSACWLDFDNDGNQDIYAAGMWVAAGMRVFGQAHFHDKEPEKIRALYRRHMAGNSLYRNQGDGRFQNVATLAGVEMGRWSWSTDAWDFDHDGYPDLYMSNGYISGVGGRDVSSFFWRQVVAKAPQSPGPSPNYELGWNAINELIRSDATWNGHERNVFFANNRDGTFSDVSGVVGLDFPEDSRTFALADLDHDGRLEIVLKNRNAPQLRILRNAMTGIGRSIAFRLRGKESNRDAIGAAVTVEAAGHRQTKYVQAGSGFLSQHTKELFFGVGNAEGPVRATIRWPSGATQIFERLPVSQRIEVEEGSKTFLARPFQESPYFHAGAGESPSPEPLASSVETWLIEPLLAPEFSLPDLAGKSWELQSLRGGFVLLNFWAAASPSSSDVLLRLRQGHSKLSSSGLQVVAINVDDAGNDSTARSFAAREALPFPTLFATQEIAGIYNIVYRYLFDRRRDLGIPTSFLIDKEGMIVKVYQGPVSPEHLLDDLQSVPRTPEDRIARALPFEGTLYHGVFQRNDFTYGVAFFQHGYLDQAAESFKQAISANPDDAEARYNLGTLYLRRNNFPEARRYLEQTVKLRPNYPEAWNNLGMLDAQEGQADKAIRNFQQSLQLRPDYAVSLVNLGNLYRRQKSFDEAEKVLIRALEIEPEDPEVNYSLGMLYAQQDEVPRASQYLEKAVSLRPDYPDALNNLGVLFVREQHYSEAEEKFKTCIQAAPNFDQAYLNLARLYVILNDKRKAREVLQALLRQQPQNVMAQQALEMLD